MNGNRIFRFAPLFKFVQGFLGFLMLSILIAWAYKWVIGLMLLLLGGLTLLLMWKDIRYKWRLEQNTDSSH